LRIATDGFQSLVPSTPTVESTFDSEALLLLVLE
jgi:hypothetical protein